MNTSKLRGVVASAGYFSRFHYDAWQRIENAEITAISDPDEKRAAEACKIFNIPKYYSDPQEMIEAEKPDFIDIITPPETHLELCRLAALHKAHVICQKPLAAGIDEAKKMIDIAEKEGIKFMVHDNLRFQPWHREIKKIIDNGTIGDLHYINFRSRVGIGETETSNPGRLSYSRQMSKMFAHETGIPFIDLFRYLAGEIEWVNAYLNRLNPDSNREDMAFVNLEFKSPVLGFLDANKYNEPANRNPGYTFGELLLEGSGGLIKLDYDGSIAVKQLGEPIKQHGYDFQDRGFAGDSVYATQQHFIDSLLNDEPFETSGRDYLNNLAVELAIYQSAFSGVPQNVSEIVL